MNKRTGIIITIILLVIVFFALKNNIGDNQNKEQLEIKTNKESIYDLFYNFPKSNNIYFTSNSLYSNLSIGPTIYQIDILAELTDEAYEEFVKGVTFDDEKDFKIKINPHNIEYQWKNINNKEIIRSKDFEDASINNIYLDESTKTIYVIAMGGN